MREDTLIRALEMHDKAINGLRSEFRAMQKVLDKTYMQSLTHVMMWDVLFELLQGKEIFTREQFDAALKELSDKTKAAMEAEQKKEAEAAELAKGKVTVLSEEPAIPVIK
jgi:hypothetical protein